MRWDNLFDDLEGQLEQELRAEELDQFAEEERLRIGRLSLRDRLVAVHEGADDEKPPVRVILNSGEHLVLRTLSFGRDWFTAQLVGDTRRPVQCVVPLAAVATVVFTRVQTELSLAPATEPATTTGQSSLASRLTLPFVLRDLCRRRAPVDVRTTFGDVHGTIDRVGRDHFDLATHESGRPRRQSAVVDHRVIPVDRLLLVRL
jgi:hypothetical protein